jgi:hypothetical protein
MAGWISSVNKLIFIPLKPSTPTPRLQVGEGNQLLPLPEFMTLNLFLVFFLNEDYRYAK